MFVNWNDKLYQRCLQTRRFGRECIFEPELDSTNTWLIENRDRFVMSGAAVVCGHQTAGRGRYDRMWFDRPGESLLFSVLLKDNLDASLAGFLSLLPCIALAQYLKDLLNDSHQVGVKWPNDVRLNEKKIAGILGRQVSEKERLIAVVGMGVNVTIELDGFPPEIRQTATSIRHETGDAPPLEIILAEILNRWEPLYDDLRDGKTDTIRERWRAFGPEVGTSLIRRDRNVEESGTFQGIGERGQLLLRDPQGKLHEIFSGDIEIP